MTQPSNQRAITQATLDELDAERRDAAAQQTELARAGVHESWVTFRVAGHWLAVDASHVEEISDQLTLLPIPRAPAHVPGLMNVRGHAVPLLDVRAFLDIKPAGRESSSTDERVRVILTHAGEMRVGLVCDQVRSLEHVDEGLLRSPAGLEGLKVGGFARAQAELATGMVTLLDLPKLLEAARVQR